MDKRRTVQHDEENRGKLPNMNLWVYCRVSTEDQEKKGYGLEDQEGRGRKLFADAKEFAGCPVLVRKEVGSGRKEAIEDRPVLKATLIKDLQHGDCIYFDDEDRMARDNGVKKEIIKQLRRKNIRLFVRTREFDLFNIQDVLQLGLKGEFDEYMGAWLVQRMHGGLVKAAQKKWIAWLTPYGYRKGEDGSLQIDPEEPKVYLMVVEWVFGGMGMRTIAKKLNLMGIPTKTMRMGKPSKRYSRKGYIVKLGSSKIWKAETVYKILTNRHYTGEMTYYGHTVIIPRLISPERWQALQDLLRARKEARPPRTNRYFYLCQGLLECSRDGRRLYGKTSAYSICCRCCGKLTAFLKDQPSAEKCPKCGSSLRETLRERKEGYYKCLMTNPDPTKHPCGLPSVNQKKIEHLVWDQVSALAKNSSKLRELLRAKQDEASVDAVLLQVEVEGVRRAVEEKKRRSQDLLLKGDILEHPERVKEALDTLDQEILELTKREERLNQELKRQAQSKEKRERIENLWSRIGERIDSFSLQERYDFLHAFVDKMVVDYDSQRKEHQIELQIAFEIDEPALLPESLQKILKK